MTTMTKNISNAIDRANLDLTEGRSAWAPVFVDLIVDGEKVAHIVSDGYLHNDWSFYSKDEARMGRRGKTFEDVIPVWIQKMNFSFGPARTYKEAEAHRKNPPKTHEELVAESNAAIVWNYKGEDITRGELWKLHKSVESSEGWKFPIDAIIDDLSDRDLALLDYAIIFFSGCSAEFFSVKGQPNKTNVVAAGYYMSIGS